MKLVIFTILFAGVCIFALPQDKVPHNETSWGTFLDDIILPLDVLKYSIQTYLSEYRKFDFFLKNFLICSTK